MHHARAKRSIARKLMQVRRKTTHFFAAAAIAGFSHALSVIAALPAAAVSIDEKPISKEFTAAISPKSEDLHGWEASLYRGTWWRAQYAGFRQCVMRRESGFRYTAKNKSSSASGAYQFLDTQWRRGLVYMMLTESRKTNDGLTEQIKPLFAQPITKWDRYFQDRAFYTAYAHGKGAAHWAQTCPR